MPYSDTYVLPYVAILESAHNVQEAAKDNLTQTIETGELLHVGYCSRDKKVNAISFNSNLIQ